MPSGVRKSPKTEPAGSRSSYAHAATAAGTGWPLIWRLDGFDGIGRRRDGQQFAGASNVALAGRAGEQAVVADAMEAARQDMQEEAADELVRVERHDLLPFGTAPTIILVPEGDASFAEGDQAPVRDRDPVRVARQIGEHGFRSGKRRLGIDHPCVRVSSGEEDGDVT